MVTWFIIGVLVGGFVGAGAAMTFMGLACASKQADFQSDLCRVSDYYKKMLMMQKAGQAKKPVAG